MTARWMPEKTPIEAMIAASIRLERMAPVKPVPAAPDRPSAPAPAPMISEPNGHSRHPAAIAAQERRRIARLAQRTREANEAARRRAHRLALEASMEAGRMGRPAQRGDD